MCGIAGILGGDLRGDALLSACRAMTDAIASRGPDDQGHWLDATAGVALGHRRLSILDLSPAGHQPMRSASGRYVMVFNGEIYNHLEMRRELLLAQSAPQWRGHSDTETLLAGIDAWGLEQTIRRSTGMFALALWDTQQKTLSLARDRLGEKPLYYGWQGEGRAHCLMFASELKALRAHPAFGGRVSRDALALFMRHNYVPAPHSIYTGIYKLPPASILVLDRAGRGGAPVAYWSAPHPATRGAPVVPAPQQAVDELDVLLRDAVRQQMVADVPLGAFLSGGIDSSTVVALMQAQASRQVRTFSIGFDIAGYDEAVHARRVAEHLGTEHTELYVTAEQALKVIPRLPAVYDEPFADSSQIPTLLVAQLARAQVTVALSGDGGDELFGGYARYVLAARLWRRLEALPAALRKFAARLITAVPPQVWSGMGALVSSRLARLGDRLHKGAGVLASSDIDRLYLGLVSHWDEPAALVLGSTEPATVLNGKPPLLDGLDEVERMMALDLVTYLPDDILVKVDRAAMAVSLETRIPLLDHRVVEFAWSLPLSLKLRDGAGKWILRQVLYRHVPPALIDRPKMGFGVPLDSWLRGPLRNWAEALLEPERLGREGWFDPAPIRRKWAEHLSGRRNWAYHLWDVLVFQAWLEAQAQ
ncbi:MAG: asparagine synthase (glutamine-hydrolyzing) [Rhodocyclaceae bacterium]|nr:asparagine synthase (glutamine-hydrolyzing) [Rhodocyclaceae bacterium]